MAKTLQAAVVGASTLLGKELIDEVGNSAAGIWDLKLLDEGEETEGQLTAAGEEALVIQSVRDESFENLDLVFFAAAPELTQKYGKAAVRAGAAVVDLTGTMEKEPGFLLRSPWIEASRRPDLMTTGVVVPHPAALMLALVADRLKRRFGTVHLAATVLEPASQAGSAGVDELHQQTVGLLTFQELPKKVFDAQVAFNVQGSLGDEGTVQLDSTRELIRKDVLSLLGADFDGSVSVTLLQAPVFHGYTISAHARLTQPAKEEELRTALAGGIVAAEEETLPSNQAAVESGELMVSVRVDPSVSDAAWLLLAADNLRLHARSAVAAALDLAALRPTSGVQ